MPDFDLDMIATAMDDSQMEAYLNPASGGVYFGAYGEVLGDDGEVLEEIPDDWLEIPGTPSRVAYLEMEDFAELVSVDRLREKLLRALEGRGPFRRFRDVVHNDPTEIGRIWSRYRDARAQLRSAEWLGEESLLTGADLERTTSGIRDTINALSALVQSWPPADE